MGLILDSGFAGQVGRVGVANRRRGHAAGSLGASYWLYSLPDWTARAVHCWAMLASSTLYGLRGCKATGEGFKKSGGGVGISIIK